MSEDAGRHRGAIVVREVDPPIPRPSKLVHESTTRGALTGYAGTAQGRESPVSDRPRGQALLAEKHG